MKLLPTPILFLTAAVGALLNGCATTPEAPAVSAQKASASVAAAKPAVAATAATSASSPAVPAPAIPAFVPTPPPPLDPEVTATIQHLTQGAESDARTHELADTTGFPEAIASLAPGAQAPKIEYIDSRSQPPPKGLTADGNSTALVEHDWTGLVLVPISTALSTAYTTSVRLLKVEAHPLRDGRVRIWIRVQNVGRQQLVSEIACAFRMQGETKPLSPYFYELEVPTHAYRDVFFVSPEGKLNTYTVLVRPSRSN